LYDATMTDDTTPRILQSIQAKLATLEEHAIAGNRSMGKLAESILELRRALEIQGTDIHTVALAIGEPRRAPWRR
jgi:hypothetical protein